MKDGSENPLWNASNKDCSVQPDADVTIVEAGHAQEKI
jgi:hypothetical protein